MAKNEEGKKNINTDIDTFEEETNKKTIIIITIALLVILGLIIGGVMYFNSKEEKAKDNSDNNKETEVVEKEEEETKEEEQIQTYPEAIAIIDEIAPSISISASTYQRQYIYADIVVKDNEELSSVEYAFTKSSSIEPSYTKVQTNLKKYEETLSYDAGEKYAVTYLWIKATDKQGNVSIQKKKFITAKYINEVNATSKSGDLIITSNDIIIENNAAVDNIYITDKVGLGSVTLDGVYVKQNIYINGGGTSQGVTLNNIKVGKNIIVNGQNHIRLNIKNPKDNTKLIIKSNTTLNLENATDNKVDATIDKDSKLLLNGKLDKLVVNGNATVKSVEDETFGINAQIEEVILKNGNSANIQTLVKKTNYNPNVVSEDYNKDAHVSAVATLEVKIEEETNKVKTDFSLNRSVLVENHSEDADEVKSVYKENIKLLTTAIKQNNTTEITRLLNLLGQNDIVVIITYIDTEGVEQKDIKTATHGELKKENDEPVDEEQTNYKYEKDTIYTSEQTLTNLNEEEKIKHETLVIEKNVNNEFKYTYLENEQSVDKAS